MSSGKFTRDQVLAALRALGRELERRGLHADIFIVGGAAVTLAYSQRRMTKDIDAVFEPKSAVYDAADVVGRDLRLPRGWLNDAVKGFLPGPDTSPRHVAEMPGLTVLVASPEYLLAMKLMAMRVAEDVEDIRLLLREAHITDAAAAVELLTQLYPRQDPPAATRFFLEELFGPMEGLR